MVHYRVSLSGRLEFSPSFLIMIDKNFLRPLAVCLFALTFGSFSSYGQKPIETHNGKDVAANELIVKLRTNGAADLSKINAALLSAESVEAVNPRIGLYLVRSKSRKTSALIAAFSNKDELAYVEPNYILTAEAISNDPSYSQLWGISKIGAPAAWDISTGNRNTVVGVIDSGVLWTHPDLSGNMWRAPSAFTVRVGGVNLTCPAGSRGFNSVNMTCDPLDDFGHGTHVAGTIGAAGNNGLGVTGVNWNSSIMGMKFIEASVGTGTLSNAIKCIEFAIQVKQYFANSSTPVNVRVLSNSWGGGGYSQAMLDQINSASSNEILFVAAAGNNATNTDLSTYYPAGYASSGVVSVAASNGADGLSSFSNYGATSVDLAAPGEGILSTSLADGYNSRSGTSMATPHVAGAAALIAGACPTLSTAAVKSLLLSSVDIIPGLVGKVASGGRLNVGRAIQSCAGASAPALSSITVSPSSILSLQSGVITVSLTSPAGAGGVPVSLTSSFLTGVNVPPSITIPQGASQGTVNFTAGLVSILSPFTITATSLGVTKTVSGSVSPASSSTISSQASFVGLDTTTQGNWKAKYGSDGYSLAGDGTKNPAYVIPAVTSQQYTWAPSTTDVRALQKVNGTDRIAATWFGEPTFTIDLNFTDSLTHQVAIYCLDWDNYGPRSQKVEILDSNNTVLDTRTISNFTGGQYLVWNLSGRVKIRATALSTNSVIEGIFFGTISAPATASFVRVDTTTQGNWKSTYGQDGYRLSGDGLKNPTYVTPAVTSQQHTWASSTTDVRALQKVSGTDRIAGTWYGEPIFTIDLNFTDAFIHQVAIYCLDWDSYGPRSQKIEILDSNNTVLDTRTISNFTGGQYLIWNLSGRIKIRATALSTNSVIEGIFFGSSLSSAAATFVKIDTTTKGNWKSAYGQDGYRLSGDGTKNPTYVTPAITSLQTTWVASTTDIRALQKVNDTDRIASTWFGEPTFTIDLNFTDSLVHQVAIYCLDWDNYGPRSQKVEILDSNNAVLDTRTISNFTGGQYLVWNLSGRVKIRTTALTTNSVIEGIFFGSASSVTAATFVKVDTITQGNWKSAYGQEGYRLMGDGTKNPTYVTPAITSLQTTWAASTTDIRALQKVSGTDRIASTWYGEPTSTIELNFTDTLTHQVAIYCLDWDNYGPRSQKVEILDSNNTVLDTRTVNNFTGGQYLVWNLSGSVKIRATALTTNSVIEGIFFGGAI